ncbi:hypothetical protein V2A60_008329 [Cordyceps javanica]
MPVTEFALFTLREAYDAVELLETVMECQEIQDEWVRAHHPDRCAKRASISRLYADTTTHPAAHRVAITAPWPSPEAHHQWIDTPANKGVMARFAAFLPGGRVPDHHHQQDVTVDSAAQAPSSSTGAAADDNDNETSPHRESGFLFFHMHAADPDRRPVLHEAFLPKEKLLVTRLAARGPAAREQLQARYRELQDALVAETPRDRIWAGWRIEKEADDREELVVFRTPDVPAARLAPLERHAKLLDAELRIAEIAP